MQLSAQNAFQSVGTPEAAATFMTPLVFASGNLRQMVERLRSVSDRLCGSLPMMSDAVGTTDAKPNGVFDDVRSRSAAINDMISEANELLSRIEGALP
jgi:glycerol-3-phosphate dehydrogenase